MSGQTAAYGNDINVPATGSTSWTDDVYLPPDVVAAARSAGVPSVLQTTTFSVADRCNRPTAVEATLQINPVDNQILPASGVERSLAKHRNRSQHISAVLADRP